MEQDKAQSEQILRELKLVIDFQKNEGFAIIKDKFLKRLEYLVDNSSIPDKDFENPATLAINLKARKLAAELMLQWWNEDIIGAQNNLDMVSKVPKPKPWVING